MVRSEKFVYYSRFTCSPPELSTLRSRLLRRTSSVDGRLRLIEAIFAEASFEGEKVAVERAKHRIWERQNLWGKEDPSVEFKFSMSDMWTRKVFVSLLW
jgi:hypothetical protein